MHETFRRTVSSPRNLVVVAAVAGVLGTIYGISVAHPYTVTLPPLVTLGALTAAYLYRRDASVSAASPSVRKRQFLSLYLVLVAVTVFAFARTPGYGRALPSHVLVLGLYVFAAVAVFAFDSTPFQGGVLLTTGVLHRALVYYGSATQLGLDALFHTGMAARISATGSLEPLAAASSKYWYSPVYHLTVATTGTFSGLPMRDAAFVAITIVATVVPVLVVYSLLYPFWGARVAGVGGLLFLVADRAVSHAVHVTPTTLGFVLFSLVLLAAVRYLDTGYWPYYGLFLLVLLAQIFNHQVSLFVTVVAVGAFVATRALWRGTLTRREAALVPALVSGVLYQGLVTKVNGPAGDLTLLDLFVRNFGRALESGDSAVAAQLPASADVVPADTASLTPVHVLGFALLFGLAVLGAIYWISQVESSERDFVFTLSGTTVVMSAFVFVPPLVGLYVFFSHRWIPFLYLCLAVLAAPGVAVLLSEGASRLQSGRRGQLAAVALVVVLVVAPYTALMTWNYPGALDGPVFDDAPGAQRLTATATEVATYTHVDRYGSDATVYADHAAQQMLDRNYGHAAAVYQIPYGSSDLVQRRNVLVVDRAYSRTDHAQYFIKYRGRWVRVFGEIPVERQRYSVVYSAGEDRVLYR